MNGSDNVLAIKCSKWSGHSCVPGKKELQQLALVNDAFHRGSVAYRLTRVPLIALGHCLGHTRRRELPWVVRSSLARPMLVNTLSCLSWCASLNATNLDGLVVYHNCASLYILQKQWPLRTQHESQSLIRFSFQEDFVDTCPMASDEALWQIIWLISASALYHCTMCMIPSMWRNL